jgi:L-fuconolactonase
MIGGKQIVTNKPKSELRSNVEDPIQPNLPICDPHHHFFDRPNLRYMTEELLADINSGHNITSTVFIECHAGYRQEGPEEMRPVGETEFVQKLSTKGGNGTTAIAAGIVSNANLMLGKAVEPVLAAHIKAGKDNFCGIRGNAASDPHTELSSPMSPPKGILLDERFREGFFYLEKYNLSFDVWMYFHQMRELADLARAFPNTPMILNHIGGPILTGPYIGKDEEVWAEWRGGIKTLAEYSNVVVKLGGIGMPIYGFGWDKHAVPPDSVEIAEAMSPYLLYCIEHFGVDRCMFESNFPVDKVSYSYNVIWNAFKRVAKGFSQDEKTALFHDTAVRAYRLNS